MSNPAARVSWCTSYFLWLCGFDYEAFHVDPYLASCSQVFSILFSIVITSLERECLSMCFSCICLFILHALFYVFSSSSLYQGLAVACDCGTPWIFIKHFAIFVCNDR